MGKAVAQIPQVKIENPDVGEISELLGFSIAVEDDIMVAGAPSTDIGDCTGAGVAKVYHKNSKDEWIFEAELTAEQILKHDGFAYSVAVSSDTVVVRSKCGNEWGYNEVSAHVFTRSDGIWTEQAKLINPNTPSHRNYFCSVSISDDTIIVGANWDKEETGAAYVYTRSEGMWMQQAKLTADDANYGDNFGLSVAISGDTAVVGSRRDEPGGPCSGSAYVFTRSGGVWVQQDKLLPSSVLPNGCIGYSVSVSGDRAVIGAPFDASGGRDSGAAYLFTCSGGVWKQ